MVEGYRRRSEKGNKINLDEYSGRTTSVRKLTNGKQLPSSWIEQRRLLNFPFL